MEELNPEWIAAGIAAFAGVLGFVKWLWPFLKRCFKMLFGAQQIYDRLDELGDQMSFLISEMKVNNGTSIKDQLNRVEAGVAMNSERQRARMLDSPDMVFETEPDGTCIWVNRTYARAVQRLPQELMGHGWVNAVAGDHRDRVVKGWYDSVEEDREFEMNFNFATPDGDEFPALVRSYRMNDSQGNTIGYLGSVTLL